MRRWIIASTLLLLALPGVVWACGGFFFPDSPVRQSSEQVIITVNGDGTLTAVIGISYDGEASEFSWLLPVPSVPTVEVAEDATLDLLQEVTNPTFTTPYNACSALRSTAEGLGGGGGGGGGLVGPYEYTILGGTPEEDVVGWLKDNNYTVSEEAEGIIQDYLDEGLYFIAMRLQPDASVGDIQPVKITFEAEVPVIPFRLAGIAATETVPVYAWIFADTPYQAANYANITPDFSTLAGFQGVAALSDPRLSTFKSNPLLLYDQLRRDIAAPYDGRAFITEYLNDPKNLPFDALTDPLLAEFAARFDYVTRLRVELTPEQMTDDMAFEPAPDLAPVSNQIDLNDHIENPLDYWGCHNEDILTEAEWAALADTTSSRLEFIHMDIRYPNDWQLQHFEVEGSGSNLIQDIWTASPQPLTAEEATSLIDGAVMPFPVLLIYPSDEDWFSPETIWMPLYEQGFGQGLMMRTVRTPTDFANYYDFESEISKFYTASLVALISSPEDRQTNADLYSAMVSYAGSYQYYLAEDLPHTLFTTGQRVDFGYASDIYAFVGYPAEWSASIDKDHIITIADPANPEGAYIRMTPLPTDPEGGSIMSFDNVNDTAEKMFGLPADTDWYGEDGYQCNGTLSIPFEQDGRYGFVRIMGSYWIEISAPVEDTEASELLAHLSDSIEGRFSCG